MYELLIVQILNAISFSMILILVAMGLSIIFGLMGVINMAHGEFFVLGAYTVVAVQKMGGNIWLGMALAPPVAALIGLLLEVMVRKFYTRPFVTILATWGVSIVIRQTIKISAGPGYQTVRNPIPGFQNLLGVMYPKYRILIIGITASLLIATFLIFQKTVFGMKCRAVIQNREVASALGINVTACDRSVFILGAALAGVAGAIMTPMITVNPEMGQIFLATSFLVVILGGVGNLLGVIGGGLAIGGSRFFMSYFTHLSLARIETFVLVIAIILIVLRPQGLFGKRLSGQ